MRISSVSCFALVAGLALPSACTKDRRDVAPSSTSGAGATGSGGSGGDSSGASGGDSTDPATLPECDAFEAKIAATCASPELDPAAQCPEFGGCGENAGEILSCIVDTGDWSCAGDGQTWNVTWVDCPLKSDCP